MNSQGGVLVRFNDEGDGTGRLFVRASSKGFSGEGSAWFGVEDLASFAEGLCAFPLSDQPHSNQRWIWGHERGTGPRAFGDESLLD